MTSAGIKALLRQLRGSLRVWHGHLTNDRREIAAGRLDQVMGRVAEAHARANAMVKRDLAHWRERRASGLARNPRKLHAVR